MSRFSPRPITQLTSRMAGTGEATIATNLLDDFLARMGLPIFYNRVGMPVERDRRIDTSSVQLGWRTESMPD